MWKTLLKMWKSKKKVNLYCEKLCGKCGIVKYSNFQYTEFSTILTICQSFIQFDKKLNICIKKQSLFIRTGTVLCKKGNILFLKEINNI